MNAPVRLAVLGDPLAYTRSPDLHRAGCEALGLACESRALRTPPAELPARLAELAAWGAVGCNLTMPLKEAALAHVAVASALARRARSVNTITFDAAGSRGDSTDGPGFLDLLGERGRDAAREHVLLLGAGGASRSLAAALHETGARVTVSARRPDAAAAGWVEGARDRFVAWRSADESEALRDATVVVNGTPLKGAEPPVEPDRLDPGTLVVDLTYGPDLTPWVSACRARGLEAVDGLGLLVHQARRSLAIWLGRDVPLEPLARSVGWPR